MKKEKLNANVWKLNLVRALCSFMLTAPIIVLFFKENGLSMKQVFLLQSIFSLTVILLEVPTGYFSDIFGRKKSIIIGGILATAGFALYSLSYGFWGFLMAEVILGFGLSFVSGADSAMLYDTLLENGREKEYQKMQGRNLSVGMFSESAASIAGGFLALVSLRFPLYWDAALTFFIIPAAMALYEPKKHREETDQNSFMAMAKLVKFSLNDHKKVKWLIVYSSLSSASTLVMFWLIQPYLLATKVPLGLFGAILAVLLLSASFFSWNAHRIEKMLGKKMSLALLIALPALGYFLLSSFWFVWSGIFLLFFYVARGINNPITLDYINGLISSENRGTILSVRNLIGRLIFSITGPIVGWVTDAFSLKIALMLSGMIFLVLGLIALVYLRKHKAF